VVNDAIFLIDNGRIVNHNAEAESMFGLASEQVVGMSPLDLSPETQPDGRNSGEAAGERLDAAYRGKSQFFEWRHRKADQSLFDAEVSLNRVDFQGRPAVLAIVRDISEKKKSDETARETEQMFRAIVENSHAGIFTIDEAFRITYANDMTSTMLLRNNDEIIGHDFREMLDEESIKIVTDSYLRRRMGEDVPSRYEFNIVQKDGNKRRVEISSTIFRTVSGSLRTVGQVLDITEHKKADEDLRRAHEELETRVEKRTAELREANAHLQNAMTQIAQAEAALRQSELKYRRLVQTANAIILEMDAQGKITFCNKFAEDFFGYAEAEILGKSTVGTIVPEGEASEKDFMALVADTSQRPDHYGQNEHEHVKKNGERVWIAWTNQLFFDEQGKLQRILRVGMDHTEQRKAERMLAEQAAAEERNRLARDLHDAVSQTLFSASIIADVLPQIWETNRDEGRRRLEEVRQLTRGALAEMRTLLLELRPSALMEAELGHLLHQLGESITGRSRVPVKVLVHGGYPLPPDVKVALYRIAQESLNNIAKHSGATAADISLTYRNAGITLIISDDGHGFDTGTAPRDSLGLDIMRERARQIGARLSVHSQPNQGTRVSVVWSKAAAR
jgi:PAS domain S-box-containing protein